MELEVLFDVGPQGHQPLLEQVAGGAAEFVALRKAKQMADPRKRPFRLAIPDTPPETGDLFGKVAERFRQWSP